MHHDPTREVDGAESPLERPQQVFLAEIERLAALERRKQQMGPDDEQRMVLARQVEDVAMDLMTLSRYQTRLVTLEAQSIGAAHGNGRSSHAILDDWRAAERRLHDARMVMERASDDADRLREEHRRSVRRES